MRRVDNGSRAVRGDAVFAFSPLMLRSFAALLAAAMCWCAGPSLEGCGRTTTPSFQRLKVTDLFVAVQPTAAKSPLASSQPRPTLPFLAKPEIAGAVSRTPAYCSALRPLRTKLPRARPLVGIVELRI